MGDVDDDLYYEMIKILLNQIDACDSTLTMGNNLLQKAEKSFETLNSKLNSMQTGVNEVTRIRNILCILLGVGAVIILITLFP